MTGQAGAPSPDSVVMHALSIRWLLARAARRPPASAFPPHPSMGPLAGSAFQVGLSPKPGPNP